MIQKLRNRIVAINLIAASLVLFVAVVLIFSLGYRRINDEREKRLHSALVFDPAEDDYEQIELFKDIALVVCDGTSHQVKEVYFGESCDLTEDDLPKLVERALNYEHSSGMISYNIRFVRQRTDAVVKIAFTNFTARQNSMVSYFVVSLGLLVLGLGIFLVISILLANFALKPVEDSWKKQKQFVADASHELKTPLSVIMANTEILASHGDETVQSQMKWIVNTQEEAKRMAGLVSDLLFLAKNDDGLQVQTEDVDLSNCVSTVVLGYDAIFYENKKQFSYEVTPNICVEGNLGQLKQLVNILLDNANKYSYEEGDIKLQLTTVGKQAQLSVSNNCEELSAEQISHLFDRFYTVDPSRNKNNGGNGLGLSIATTICETHGGSIVANYQSGRIDFVVTLPIKRQKN